MRCDLLKYFMIYVQANIMAGVERIINVFKSAGIVTTLGLYQDLLISRKMQSARPS